MCIRDRLGTVLNDGENQGKASINIAAVAADGQEVTSETIGYEVTDGKYVWIPYVKVTVDNYQDCLLYTSDQFRHRVYRQHGLHILFTWKLAVQY